MESRSTGSISGYWCIAAFAGFAPMLGILLIPQMWYGEGWRAVCWPLALLGFIGGFGSSIIVMIYGSWKQRLWVILPFIQYSGILVSFLF